ncbi:K(+)-transporting ATPase subunit F [Alistipes sp.]
MCGLVRKNLIEMFTGLLLLSILGFVYLLYVLLKPEKF